MRGLAIKCSLDNLTIVGRYEANSLGDGTKDNPNKDNRLKWLLDTLPLIKNITPCFKRYSYNVYCEAGVFIQLGKDRDNDRAIRVEFNPNKLNERYERDLIEILKYVMFPHYSRRDIAIDFIDEWKINDYSYDDLKTRKRITYETGNRQLETLYMGANGSDEIIRIYDKDKEQRKSQEEEGKDSEEQSDKRVWVRVEAQLRKEKADMFGYNPFESVRITRKEGAYKGLEVRERAMLELLERDPSVWDDLSKNSKSKYKKIMRENTTVEHIDVAKEFEKYIEELEADAKSWLQMCKKDKFGMIEEMEGWNSRD